MARTPDSRRIRTLWLQATQNVLAADTFDNAGDSYTFQDDIRVIGCQVSAISIISDAQMNADGRTHVYTEVSKHGTQGQSGSILKTDCMGGWTGVFSIGDNCKRESIMFPEGYGIDFDDGETIYMHGFLESIGAVDGSGLCEAIIYYVER